MNAHAPAPAASVVTARPTPAAASTRLQARPVLQLRSSAGLYGADRMVLALNQALSGQHVPSRLLSIHNYRMHEQALHAMARAKGQHAELLPCRGRFDLGTVRALAAQIDAVGAPVLHVHDYKSAFYAWLATRQRPLPMVATLHGWLVDSHSQRLYNRIELALLRRFDALAVVSHEQIEPLLRAGIPRGRIHQVDNGIELPSGDVSDAAALRREFGLDAARFVFGAVARLSPEKNLAMLLEAITPLAKADAGVALVIAGDGPERAILEARAQSLGIASSVHFLGARADMERLYPVFDCLVLPSLSEGMPLVVLEAMAFSLPILASAVGGIPRLLAHTEHGRLVRPGDADALRAELQAASAEPGRRDRHARSYVRHQHSPEAMAQRYLTVYRSLPTGRHERTTA
ncbi:glycosyltransferase [Lysobacter cavernae]|uniref:Glycosyltransferase n=1 Tax=Lysobacter cavernae TaxID=1685901 RepID=A0ABV7RNL7_9GAMM